MSDILLAGMMTEEEFLEQAGVKGMKWGVRKDRPEAKPELSVKLKGGGELQVYRDPSTAMQRFLSAKSPKYKEALEKRHNFTLKNEKGQKVGEAAFNQDGPDSLNLEWIGVRGAHRGNGYASAALQGVVNYAEDRGLKKLTLEVPGNSPDALHIYEKLGFKKVETPVEMQDPDDFWGGLTNMEMDVKQKIKHAAIDPSDIMKYIERSINDNLPEDDSLEQSNRSKNMTDTMTGMMSEETFLKHMKGELSDDELEQAGVKGMKWGVRKSDKLGPDGNPAKSRKELRALDRAARTADAQASAAKRKADIKRNDQAIIDARTRRYSGDNAKAAAAARKQYKVDKKVVGKYTAKKNLNKVYEKNPADYKKSNELLSGRETTAATLAQIGGEILKVYVNNKARQ